MTPHLVREEELPPRGWRVREVARRLQLTPSTVYRLIEAGDIGAVRIGRCLVILECDLLRFLEERRQGATP